MGCGSSVTVDATIWPLWEKVIEEHKRDAPLDVTNSSLLNSARQLHFVFVGGIFTELDPGYFKDNGKVIEEIGATYSIMFPPSTASLEEDAKLLYERVSSENKQIGKPIVLVGHSKGACDVVMLALLFPQLVTSGQIDRIVAIQGPLQGSVIAGDVADVGSLVLPNFFKGLASCGPKVNELFQEKLLKLLQSQRTELNSRIFYVRSSEALVDVSLIMKASWDLCVKLTTGGSGRSDGLADPAKMKIDGFGIDLGELIGDHALFTVPILPSIKVFNRKAFTRALIREIFDSKCNIKANIHILLLFFLIHAGAIV